MDAKFICTLSFPFHKKCITLSAVKRLFFKQYDIDGELENSFYIREYKGITLDVSTSNRDEFS